MLKIFASKKKPALHRNLDVVEAKPVQMQDQWAERSPHLHQFLLAISKMVEFIGKNQTAVNSGVEEVLSRAEVLKSAIEEAEQEFYKAQDQMTQTKSGIAQNLKAINTQSTSSLHELAGVMEGQIGKASQVLESIENIARELKIIVLNVSLEANRLGAAGDSIKAIAVKVGQLAQDALSSAQKTKADLDLDSLKQKLNGFQTQVTNLTIRAEEEVGHSMQALEGSFLPLSAALAHIKNDQANIFEVKKIEAQVFRTQSRLSMITGMINEVSPSLESDFSGSQLSFFDTTERIVRRSFGFSQEDSLQEIKRRGVLRVAIEPSFVGLSFRHGGNELQGLDVDYAKAYAAWLGVAIEFVEGPWDQCPEYLLVPPNERSKRADLMWSGLIPDPAYNGLAFSDPYTKFEFVLARRSGDHRIRSLRDLDGLVLGCIADPAVYALVESEGLRWSENRSKPGGRTNLGKLQKYSDQTLIHECLVKGDVDAFLVDLPIYHWASINRASPWCGKVEIVDKKVGPDSYVYSVGVDRAPHSLALLESINAFLVHFAGTSARRAIDSKWLGHEHSGTFRLHDFAPTVVGEDELRAA